ncbi:MAG TPA: ribosomal-processing cysteine protease Prp [Pseudobacteroides sp.]|uniref:ribosomal-processing cysteine protease Prp n=1 Tax=Pseudobacteroides sp. TaxID=1968840 RepID=UPI002F95E36B
MKSKILLLVTVLILSFVSGCVANSDGTKTVSPTNTVTKVDYDYDEEKAKVEFEDLGKDHSNTSKGIEVVVFENEKGIKYGFIVSGHSGYADKGQDIICSAVSILVINTINSVDRYTTEKYIKDVKEDGYVKCYLPKLKYGRGSNEAELLVKSMVSGLEDIQNSYGEEFVRVVYEKD